MRKRSSKKKPDDVQPAVPDETAEEAAQPAPEVEEATAAGKNPAAVALGRLGGRKGGAARAKKLTKEERVAIARKAAQARWANRHNQ